MSNLIFGEIVNSGGCTVANINAKAKNKMKLYLLKSDNVEISLLYWKFFQPMDVAKKFSL